MSMGETGYTKCKNLVDKLLLEKKTALTMEELKLEIAKRIGFSIAHNTVNNYFNALKMFGFIKLDPKTKKFILVEK